MGLTLPDITQASSSIIPATRDNSLRSSQAVPIGTVPATDKVSLGANTETAAIYADPRSNATQRTDISAMLEESQRQTQQVLDLLLPLLEQQGLNIAKVVSGEQTLSADPATIAQAQAAIADDGEYGVTQVAQRILNFAQAVIGNDPSKLDGVRAAVEKGFAEATKILGGTLPEISQKTYAAVMAGFDSWASASAAPQSVS